MRQIPGYNLYAVRKSEISSVRLDSSPGVIWYPNELGGWYICSKDAVGVTLLSGPHRDERIALSHATAMTDTGGT